MNDHIDDLFKKAADNYPLKTSTGNWDKLETFLNNDNLNKHKSLYKRKKGTLLFLIAICLLISTVLKDTINHYNSGKNSLQARNSIGVISDRNSSSNHANLLPSRTTVSNPASYIDEENINSVKTKAASKKITITKNIVPDFTTENSIERKLNTKENLQPDPIQTISSNTLKPISPLVSNSIAAPVGETEATINNIKKDSINTATPTYNFEIKRKQKPKFYYGISVGMAYNQIKNQQITSPEWNGGVLAGLQISDHFAIESGIQFSQKRYYSKGLYFNPKYGSMPADMIVKYLNGKSDLIEIPISIKYNFKKGGYGFYGIAGLSSYLMTTESNRYMAEISGEEKEINSTYHSMHNYLASILNIGVGYQFVFRRNTVAAIQPYVQLPLRGMGIGSMQVRAMGVHLILRKK